jgi:hypothetical protein
MARRSSGTAEAQPEATDNTEAPETSNTEAPASTESTPKADEKPIDLGPFQAAVGTAVQSADPDDGSLTDEAQAPVQAAYRELDGQKAKNAAKSWLQEKMKEEMNALNIGGARTYMQLGDNLTAGATGAQRPPADPTEAFVQRAASLQLATQLLRAPEGVEGLDERVAKAVAEASEQAQALQVWTENEAEDKGDAPTANAVASTAVKLATAKVRKSSGGGGGTGDGVRRDIGKHISEAFEGVPSGTFLTVAQIRGHKSTEYGDIQPSAGAISARLFPSSGKCTVEGITPGQSTDGKGNRGATKV